MLAAAGIWTATDSAGKQNEIRHADQGAGCTGFFFSHDALY